MADFDNLGVGLEVIEDVELIYDIFQDEQFQFGPESGHMCTPGGLIFGQSQSLRRLKTAIFYPKNVRN